MTQRLSASRNIVGRNRIPVNYPEEAQCSMPLECNAFMSRGTGAISFTRATPATCTDFEGNTINVLSGEARFENARRVRNNATYSQDFTNVIWQKNQANVALHTETMRGIPVFSITDTTSNDSHWVRQAIAHTAGNQYIVSYKAKAGTATFCQISPAGGLSAEYANFDLSNGTVTGGNISQASISPIENGYYRISLRYTSTITGSQVTGLVMINSGTAGKVQTYIGTGSTIYATAGQHEDVTRQSVQTVGEYVSTNVLSGLFHGAFVDGVKYFNTRLDGTYIENGGYLPESATTNICTRSEDFTTGWTITGGGSVTPNSVNSCGETKASTFTLSATTGSQFLYFPFTATAARHGLSIDMKPNGHNLWQIATSSANGTGYINFDISNGSIGSSSGFLIRIKAKKDGWYRIEVTTSVLTAALGGMALSAISSLTNGRLPASTGTGTSGAYIWGAQIETGLPTSYMPTSGLNAIRNDDILTIDLANTQSTQGTWFADTNLNLPSSLISAFSATGRFFGSSATTPGVYWNTNGTISVHDGSNTINTSNFYTGNGRNKVAYGFSGSTMTVSLNGTNTVGSFDGTNSFALMCIGNATAVSRGLTGIIRNVQFWGYRLDNSDMSLITTL